MVIKRLKLTSFRSYKNLNVEFTPNVNFITGKNGVGKTNILEAISLLSFGKSFVTSNENNCITTGDDFLKIEADVNSKKVNRISIVISQEGKIVTINGKDINRISDMATKIITVNFSPKDVRIFKDSPLERRKFIDMSISLLSIKYISYLSIYKDLLKRRNLLLKQEIDSMHIDVIDSQLAPVSYEIIKIRRSFIEKLDEIIKKNYRHFFRNEYNTNLIYITSINYSENKEEYINQFLKSFKDNYETDIKRKSTTKGIHHDDIVFYLNEKNIAVTGSQGQNRIASLILKLSLGELLEKQSGEKPVLLLDDVLSELDENVQKQLSNVLKEKGQVFITGTEVPKIFSNYTEYVVSNHEMRRK